jgi:MarR family transcriptional regulator, organic hydroperoxide resistance regulator
MRGAGKTPVRGADVDLCNSIPALMRQVHRGLSRGMEQRTGKYGISIGTWYFLRVLWAEDGLTQSELSDRIGIVGPTTVMAINRMVRDGLVVRSTDPDDRRKGRIYLTARAKRLKTKMLNEASEFVEQVLVSIPERDIQQFRTTLRRIALNLKPYLPPMVFSRITGDLIH